MRILFVSVLLLFSSITLLAQQSHTFPIFKDAPLGEVLLYLESNFELVFSYRDNNVQEESVSMPSGKFELKNYISKVFEQTNLDFEYIDSKYIILTTKASADHPTTYLCGYIKDHQTGDLLQFANVLLINQQKGTSTSEDGYFKIDDIKIGDTLIISYIGYDDLQIIIAESPAKSCLTFHLKVSEMSMPPVLVTVYLMDGILQDGHGQKVIIKPAKLSVFPGSVEPDIMNSIQMLPGIFSANETASGINIRGGTPDQNLVLYDDIPIYHTGHFFGMISAFNPYIVKEVNVYRSGMSSEYGGRVSGVIDIKGDNTLPDKFSLGLGLNMTHGHLNTKVPIGKKSAVTLSLRRSFTDFLPSPTFLRYAEKVFQGTRFSEDDIPGTGFEANDQFYFSDFNFKWNWNPGKNKFGIDLFSGFNNLDYSTEIPEYIAFSKDEVELENIGFSLYWARDWNPRFSSQMKLTNSSFNYFYKISFALQAFPENELISGSITNSVDDGGFNWINTWKPQKNHRVKFGYQYTDNQLGLDLTQKEIDTTASEQQKFEHKLHTLFGEYHLSLADILELDIGLRYQRQTIIKNYYFEPRVALTARINPSLKLKLSSSKQFQFISQLVVLDLNNLEFANGIWVASDNSIIPVIESNQWTGGLLYSKNDWKIDLEGYVKEIAGLTSLSNSFGDNIQKPYSRGNSRIRGIDILIKKRFNDRYRSWLSYTLSQAVYEFPELNENVFPASHDQRHTLQWVHLFKSDPWEFALGWQFGSGLPFTNALGVEMRANQDSTQFAPYINYDTQNSGRLRPYHKLDASIMYNFKKDKRFNGFVGLSLVNIYNNRNTIGKQFFLEDLDSGSSDPELLQIDQLGLRFTPNLVFRIQW